MLNLADGTNLAASEIECVQGFEDLDTVALSNQSMMYVFFLPMVLMDHHPVPHKEMNCCDN